MIKKGTDRCSFNAASTCSIWHFTPPVLIVLSFLPKMRRLVLSVYLGYVIGHQFFSQISGAYITKVFSLPQTDLYALERGAYQSEASGPFSLRRAMCDKVSVMP